MVVVGGVLLWRLSSLVVVVVEDLGFFSMLKGLPDPMGTPGGGVIGGCARFKLIFLWLLVDFGLVEVGC